ncbi:hypothetical protein D3P07_00685 [Paenibacillus sp. 1011MAR3C5]|nr:hypothetical protein D3P07_00685 [Paenibacillus sp. 1011MAR3C5]
MNQDRGDASITIDGVGYTYSGYSLAAGTGGTYQGLVYENTSLSESEHTVVIQKKSGSFLDIDAFDFSESSELLAPPRVIGEQLTAPEAGWKRYDNKDSNIKFTGTWNSYANVGYSSGELTGANVVGNKIEFSFKGTMIRIIDEGFTNRSSVISITIDGVTETYSAYRSSSQNQTLVYEKTGLSNKFHTVTIELKEASKWIGLDAIDIDATGELREPYNKFLISSNSSIYSLSEENGKNVLINVSSASENNFIKHGFIATSINFIGFFKDKSFVSQTNIEIGAGRVFKQSINTEPIPIKNMSIE